MSNGATRYPAGWAAFGMFIRGASDPPRTGIGRMGWLAFRSPQGTTPNRGARALYPNCHSRHNCRPSRQRAIPRQKPPVQARPRAARRRRLGRQGGEHRLHRQLDGRRVVPRLDPIHRRGSRPHARGDPIASRLERRRSRGARGVRARSRCRPLFDVVTKRCEAATSYTHDPSPRRVF